MHSSATIVPEWPQTVLCCVVKEKSIPLVVAVVAQLSFLPDFINEGMTCDHVEKQIVTNVGCVVEIRGVGRSHSISISHLNNVQ